MAKTLWQRFRASWTVWACAVVTALPEIFSGIEVVLSVLSASDAQQVIKEISGPYTAIVYRGIGVVTLLCRMRSLMKESKP